MIQSNSREHRLAYSSLIAQLVRAVQALRHTVSVQRLDSRNIGAVTNLKNLIVLLAETLGQPSQATVQMEAGRHINRLLATQLSLTDESLASYLEKTRQLINGLLTRGPMDQLSELKSLLATLENLSPAAQSDFHDRYPTT